MIEDEEFGFGLGFATASGILRDDNDGRHHQNRRRRRRRDRRDRRGQRKTGSTKEDDKEDDKEDEDYHYRNHDVEDDEDDEDEDDERFSSDFPADALMRQYLHQCLAYHEEQQKQQQQQQQEQQKQEQEEQQEQEPPTKKQDERIQMNEDDKDEKKKESDRVQHNQRQHADEVVDFFRDGEKHHVAASVAVAVAVASPRPPQFVAASSSVSFVLPSKQQQNQKQQKQQKQQQQQQQQQQQGSKQTMTMIHHARPPSPRPTATLPMSMTIEAVNEVPSSRDSEEIFSTYRNNDDNKNSSSSSNNNNSANGNDRTNNGNSNNSNDNNSSSSSSSSKNNPSADAIARAKAVIASFSRPKHVGSFPNTTTTTTSAMESTLVATATMQRKEEDGATPKTAKMLMAPSYLHRKRREEYFEMERDRLHRASLKNFRYVARREEERLAQQLHLIEQSKAHEAHLQQRQRQILDERKRMLLQMAHNQSGGRNAAKNVGIMANTTAGIGTKKRTQIEQRKRRKGHVPQQPHPQQRQPPTAAIYVAGLKHPTEQGLRDLFSSYGFIAKVHLYRSKITGELKGDALVVYELAFNAVLSSSSSSSAAATDKATGMALTTIQGTTTDMPQPPQQQSKQQTQHQNDEKQIMKDSYDALILTVCGQMNGAELPCGSVLQVQPAKSDYSQQKDHHNHAQQSRIPSPPPNDSYFNKQLPPQQLQQSHHPHENVIPHGGGGGGGGGGVQPMDESVAAIPGNAAETSSSLSLLCAAPLPTKEDVHKQRNAAPLELSPIAKDKEEEENGMDNLDDFFASLE